MLRLSQARRKNANAGQPIHLPFQAMRDSETFIRRGELTLIAGGPGTGKSAVTQAILQRGNGLKGPDRRVNSVLYFSADSDSTTMFKRAVAIETGWLQQDVDRLIREGQSDYLDSIVEQAQSHMWWQFRSSPDDTDVKNHVEGFATTYGEFPQVIVMDNLKNLYAGEGGEFEALEGNCEFLHELARETNAAVITLHHVIGANEDGLSPIPLSGLRGKVSKTPAVVLTLHRSDTHLFISPAKNRNGRGDPSGQWTLPIRADLSRMSYEG